VPERDSRGKLPSNVEAGWLREPAAFREACEQLTAYFAGTLREFDLALAPAGTDFQRIVWHELTQIPFGDRISYGELARRIGKPAASRAVGRANGQNPISIIVPCHRVIGADGTMTGYGGGIDRKRWLLEHESGQRILIPA
jgi:methylated-DNA-[protein]-cysteine S-methyltransferase